MDLEIKNGVPVLNICPNCREMSFSHYTYWNGGIRTTKNVGKCIINQCGYDFTYDAYRKSQPKGVPYDLVKKSIEYSRNYPSGFKLWLESEQGKKEADGALSKYCIGTSQRKKGGAIFWQINEENIVIQGRIRKINWRTGEIDDTYISSGLGPSYNRGNRVERIETIEGINRFNFSDHYHLFGQHLLKLEPKKRIMILTDEISAVIASIKYPEYIWLACTYDSKELKGRIKDYLPDAIWHPY